MSRHLATLSCLLWGGIGIWDSPDLRSGWESNGEIDVSQDVRGLQGIQRFPGTYVTEEG